MFRITPDHEEIRQAAREFFDACAPVDSGQIDWDSAAIRNWWKKAADELALTGVLLPEDVGGLGLDFGYTAVVLEESGRSLLDVPLVPVAAGAEILRRATDTALRDELLSSMLDGGHVVGAALGGESVLGSVGLSSSDGRLTGVLRTVLHAEAMDALLVAGVDEAGAVSLHVVDTDAAGCTVVPLPGIDLRRQICEVRLDGVAARRIDLDQPTDRVHARVRGVARISVGLEQLGLAERAMEIAVEYAKAREQFGRPIGSFQAIKHRCAEMLVRVENARSAAYFGVQRVIDDGDLVEPGLLCRIVGTEAAYWVAFETIQVLGGIGFTWEHPAHLFARRATSARVLLDSPERARDLLVADLERRSA